VRALQRRFHSGIPNFPENVVDSAKQFRQSRIVPRVERTELESMAMGFGRFSRWVNFVEKKLFPNDSRYQRIRRRRICFVALTGLALLVWGVVQVTTRVSHMTGARIEKAPSRKPVPPWLK
jgi:hypothetical protein